MYKHLIKNLEEDLEVFDDEDCEQIRQLIDYLKSKEIPLKIIQKECYEYYKGWCIGQKLAPMTEWQFELCKTEMNW